MNAGSSWHKPAPILNNLERVFTMALTPELQEYYEEQFNMMASKGWHDMTEDLRSILGGLKDIMTVTPDTLLNRQGRIAELSLILDRPSILARAYEELNNAP